MAFDFSPDSWFLHLAISVVVILLAAPIVVFLIALIFWIRRISAGKRKKRGYMRN